MVRVRGPVLAATIDATAVALALGLAAYLFLWAVRLYRWSRKHTERWSNEMQYAILLFFFGAIAVVMALIRGLKWIADYMLT